MDRAAGPVRAGHRLGVPARRRRARGARTRQGLDGAQHLPAVRALARPDHKEHDPGTEVAAQLPSAARQDSLLHTRQRVRLQGLETARVTRVLFVVCD